MRIKGKITKWNDEKGFGFLKPSTGDKEVFVHISEFNNRNRRPKLNELVTYSLATDKQGRPRAVHATLPGDKRRKTANHSRGAFSIIASIIFFVIVVLNCGAFVWLLTPNGSAMFHSFLEVLQGLTMGSS
jgi:cold shock CspA family protein